MKWARSCLKFFLNLNIFFDDGNIEQHLECFILNRSVVILYFDSFADLENLYVYFLRFKPSPVKKEEITLLCKSNALYAWQCNEKRLRDFFWPRLIFGHFVIAFARFFCNSPLDFSGQKLSSTILNGHSKFPVMRNFLMVLDIEK